MAGDGVEMTDVPAVVMEAILSYMYTGRVANIGKIAYQLLPAAEEYGLVATLAKNVRENTCQFIDKHYCYKYANSCFNS